MPESASAVSQIAEKEHSWGKQMKERAAENGREMAGDRRKGKFERIQRNAKCFKMADVRSQGKMVLGMRS